MSKVCLLGGTQKKDKVKIVATMETKNHVGHAT